MKEEFIIIKQSELDEDTLDEIIKLKQQHWNYSYESQKEWIFNYVEPNALHLLLKVNNKYVGYLSIRNIGMKIDDIHMEGKGLGNVCIDKEFRNCGYGRKLVEKANQIIIADQNVGILLCHTHLLSFYERCGWNNVGYDNLEIDKKIFSDVLMLFNYDLNHISHMVLDRNF